MGAAIKLEGNNCKTKMKKTGMFVHCVCLTFMLLGSVEVRDTLLGKQIKGQKVFVHIQGTVVGH